MRTLVLHPVRPKGEATAIPRDALAEAVSLAGALDLDVVGAEVVPLPQGAGRHAVRQGQDRGADRADRASARPGSWSSTAPLSPVQQRNLEKALEGQGARPHRADPRDLRRPGADPRGRAAGRARASQLPEVAAGAVLDPPRAAARRLRLPRRPRRDADRGRPAGARRAHPADQAGARQGGADPRPAPQRRGSGCAVSGGGAGRLHQRRQVDAVQPADRRRACWPRTCSSPRSTRRCARSRCRTAAGRSCPTRSASSPTCRPAGRRVPRHARGGAGGRPDPARARHRPPRERDPGGERARDPRRARASTRTSRRG